MTDQSKKLLNTQCTKCGSYKTVYYKKMLYNGAIASFVIGVIIFILIPILRPASIICLIAGYRYKGTKYYCNDCRSNFRYQK